MNPGAQHQRTTSTHHLYAFTSSSIIHETHRTTSSSASSSTTHETQRTTSSSAAHHLHAFASSSTSMTTLSKVCSQHPPFFASHLTLCCYGQRDLHVQSYHPDTVITFFLCRVQDQPSQSKRLHAHKVCLHSMLLC